MNRKSRSDALIGGAYVRARAASSSFATSRPSRWSYRLSIAVLAIVAVTAIAGPLLEPTITQQMDLASAYAGMSWEHPLGTDFVGRDTLAMLMYGTRLSVILPLIVVIASTLAGIVLGIVSGWFPGWIDSLVNRVIEFVLIFPSLLLAILAVALFGTGVVTPTIAISVAFTPMVARLVRSLVQSESEKLYIVAYRLHGTGYFRLLFRYLLPNIMSPIAALATLNLGYALIDLVGLSFLGLGVQPPEADWGVMINAARNAIMAGKPLSLFVPCIAVVVLLISFNTVGQRVADQVGRRQRA